MQKYFCIWYYLNYFINPDRLLLLCTNITLLTWMPHWTLCFIVDVEVHFLPKFQLPISSFIFSLKISLVFYSQNYCSCSLHTEHGRNWGNLHAKEKHFSEFYITKKKKKNWKPVLYKHFPDLFPWFHLQYFTEFLVFLFVYV